MRDGCGDTRAGLQGCAGRVPAGAGGWHLLYKRMPSLRAVVDSSEATPQGLARRSAQGNSRSRAAWMESRTASLFLSNPFCSRLAGASAERPSRSLPMLHHSQAKMPMFPSHPFILILTETVALPIAAWRSEVFPHPPLSAAVAIVMKPMTDDEDDGAMLRSAAEPAAANCSTNATTDMGSRCAKRVPPVCLHRDAASSAMASGRFGCCWSGQAAADVVLVKTASTPILAVLLLLRYSSCCSCSIKCH